MMTYNQYMYIAYETCDYWPAVNINYLYVHTLAFKWSLEQIKSVKTFTIKGQIV